ncbi:MAG: hypothetical protein RID53_05340 [Coleofasciculus sp. B1-GNL1-01]|uniref:hypothetical protein n=1 Tax=Coleofasciculus sp. B1-GNL1-01 TaxID=3068484 RepID=UPI0032F0AC82
MMTSYRNIQQMIETIGSVIMMNASRLIWMEKTETSTSETPFSGCFMSSYRKPES